jgi:Mn-dependent DtxR family transcriptional regulator
MRPRDIAARLATTERSAYAMVIELAEAGYVVKQKDGPRNRYQVQARQPSGRILAAPSWWRSGQEH